MIVSFTCCTEQYNLQHPKAEHTNHWMTCKQYHYYNHMVYFVDNGIKSDLPIWTLILSDDGGQHPLLIFWKMASKSNFKSNLILSLCKNLQELSKFGGLFHLQIDNQFHCPKLNWDIAYFIMFLTWFNRFINGINLSLWTPSLYSSIGALVFLIPNTCYW